MRTWKKFQHLLGPDARADIFREACAVAGVAPTEAERRLFDSGEGPAYYKRTTAKRRLVQRRRRARGLLSDDSAGTP